jgi:hypothetical protein
VRVGDPALSRPATSVRSVRAVAVSRRPAVSRAPAVAARPAPRPCRPLAGPRRQPWRRSPAAGRRRAGESDRDGRAHLLGRRPIADRRWPSRTPLGRAADEPGRTRTAAQALRVAARSAPRPGAYRARAPRRCSRFDRRGPGGDATRRCSTRDTADTPEKISLHTLGVPFSLVSRVRGTCRRGDPQPVHTSVHSPALVVHRLRRGLSTGHVERVVRACHRVASWGCDPHRCGLVGGPARPGVAVSVVPQC